jgi:hypothetical protein
MPWEKIWITLRNSHIAKAVLSAGSDDNDFGGNEKISFLDLENKPFVTLI